MNTESFPVHPQLKADSHELFDWQHCHLRLHKNATLPWLIIIPKTDLIEWHDLPAKIQTEISHISRVSGAYFKKQCGTEKINFAAIGNVVQQLHIHVVGRHTKDPLWPNVVWGNQLVEKTYNPNQVSTIKKDLKILLEQTN